MLLVNEALFKQFQDLYSAWSNHKEVGISIFFSFCICDDT